MSELNLTLLTDEELVNSFQTVSIQAHSATNDRFVAKFHAIRNELIGRLVAARTENKRLRKSLQMICAMSPEQEPDPAKACGDMQSVARTALDYDLGRAAQSEKENSGVTMTDKIIYSVEPDNDGEHRETVIEVVGRYMHLDEELDLMLDELTAALQSVHERAVEQTWKNAHKLAFNWATWEGEYETDTKTVLANLAGTFVNLSRNAPPINQQASHKEQAK